MRLSMHPLEGLVLHTVGYDDDGTTRPVLHRASISEMVVPYGDPGPMHGWKNAFDVGEWGLGRMANSLALGCDCLGEITYLDAAFATEHGHVQVLENAICIHEEDYGILWKHQDMNTGHTEVRRVPSPRRLLHRHRRQLRVRLLLVLLPRRLHAARGEAHRHHVDPGASPRARRHRGPHRWRPGAGRPLPPAPVLRPARLTVDGPVNEVHEVSFEPAPEGPDNPWGNAMRQQVTRLDTESAARRDVDPASSRHWRFVNPSRRNALGRPVAYKLVAGATPDHAGPTRTRASGRRAGFARHNLWVTPDTPGQRRAAGDYPNQHAGR